MKHLLIIQILWLISLIIIFICNIPQMIKLFFFDFGTTTRKEERIIDENTKEIRTIVTTGLIKPKFKWMYKFINGGNL